MRQEDHPAHHDQRARNLPAIEPLAEKNVADERSKRHLDHGRDGRDAGLQTPQPQRVARVAANGREQHQPGKRGPGLPADLRRQGPANR
ncbi:MAG: hypothetical protein NT169_10635 [Chloroflexi bacterium]|nr:hypothetical protein [Chloroflexota bacterium]